MFLRNFLPAGQLKLLCVILILGFISHSTVSLTENDWELLLDENEKLALDAIKFLHRQLDDDKDGNINLDESNEYLREELKYEGNYEKRQKVFHRNNDNEVTVRDLWETWVKSEVHNWTVEQTVDWLSVFVGLPQYSNIFIQNSINGSYLPRLAVNHLQFLSSGLGVKDIIHRQKVSLKAQDVVLFGPPKDHTTYVKDVILTSLLVIATGICWNVYVRYKSSQRELTKIIKDMEGLAKAEKELQDLQNIMEKNKVEREEMSKQIEKSMSQKSFSHLELPDDEVRDEITRLRTEVEVLRSELQRAEVELQDKCWVPPPALQHWLQLTYELELKTYNKKKQSAERQLRQAKDACDKLKKKRSSLMGAFVSTHGKSIDDVDKAILEAKGSLTEITHELQERMHRWKQIEILANCPIMNNPGLHYLETVLRGYGKASSYGGPGSVISNSQDDIDDDAASSIYCPSAVHKLVSTSTCLMFPAGYPTATAAAATPINPPPTSFALPHIVASSSRRSSYQQQSTIVNGGGSNIFIPASSPHNTFVENGLIVGKDKDLKTSSPSTASFTTSQIIQNPSIESDDTVSSVPVSSSALQLSMPRSKSVTNMINLRGNAGKELVSRDSSTGDEGDMPGDASEMASRSDKDRRVTFGLRNPRVVGDKHSNGLERMPNARNSLTATNEKVIVSEEEVNEDEESQLESITTTLTEKPDLLKLSPSSHLTEEEFEKKVTSLSEVSSSITEISTSGPTPLENGIVNGKLTEQISKLPSNDIHEANGVNIPRKVRFSEKVGVGLRSFSRLVSASTENLKSNKNYKVHVGDSSLNPTELPSIGEIKGVKEKNEKGEIRQDHHKKIKSRILSSFRGKKKKSLSSDELKSQSTSGGY